MTVKRFFSFLLLNLLLTIPRIAYATVDILMVNPPGARYEVAPCGAVTFTVFMIVEDVPNACADLYARAIPDVGAVVNGQRAQIRADGTFRVDMPYTAPEDEGLYGVTVEAWVIRCDNVETYRNTWDLTVNVSGNRNLCGGGNGGDVESDLDVSDHDFPATTYIGEEECGDIEIENDDRNITYEITEVSLRARGVQVEWGDRRDTSNVDIGPRDDEWVGDPFCFTPLEAGTLRLDVIVELEDDDNEYDIDTIRIEVLDPACVRTECWNDDRWCINRNGARDHLIQDCGNDTVGQCGASFCSNDDVMCTRTDFDHSCSNDSCQTTTREVTVVVQDCGVDTLGVCRNNRCDGNRVICDRTDTDRYCANAQCGSQQIGRTVITRTCANNEQCVNAACIPNDCVRTECWNDDRWCVGANGNHTRITQDCGNDEIGQCRNYQCNEDGDVVCDRTDVDHFCLENQCRQQSNERTIVADDCLAALEVCQDGECANRCVFDCFDQCVGDTLVVRACEGFVCEEQSRDDCNRFDRRDPVERYCRDNAVYGRQRVTNGSCGGALNDCQTRVSTEELGLVDACADYCDGSVAVSSRDCQNGVCEDGERVDCSTRIILDSPVQYCLGDELRQHRRFVHNTCDNGTCNASPEQWVNDLGIQNCAWGCDPDADQCNPDPCENVQCNASCDGNTRRYNGRCVVQNNAPRCEYDNEDCNARDRDLGGRQQYCSPDNTAVWSRQPREDFSCGGGECVGQSTFVDWREETVCSDYCNGSVSVWGRACQDSACTQGNRVDCDAMDTEPQTIPYCGVAINDDVVHAYDWRRNFSCILETGRCDQGVEVRENERDIEYCAERDPLWQPTREFCDGDIPAVQGLVDHWMCAIDRCMLAGPDFIRDEVRHSEPCALEERCDDGHCILCEPEWRCGDWSACNGPAIRTRRCVDEYECLNAERPAEEMFCACEITDAWWTWDPAGEELVDDVVQENQTVYLAVSHEGSCDGRVVHMEWWENDWAFLSDDRLDPELLAYRDRFLPATLTLQAGGLTTLEWRVVYDPLDWGYNEYYVRFPEFDRDSDLLEVEPHSEELGDLATLLVNNPAEPYRIEDSACFHGERVTITQRCMELWEQAGIVAEAEFEEDVQDIIEFILGVGAVEVIWNVACLVCEFGGPPAVAAACFPEPVAVAACPVTFSAVVICDIGCLGPVGRFLGRIAGKLWRWLLDTHIGLWAGRMLREGWQVIEREARDDLASLALRHGDDTLDAAHFPDPINPRRIVDKQYRNIILRYQPGGGEFVEFNVRKNGLFQPDWQNFRTGPMGEYQLLSALHQDNFLQSRFDGFVADLGAGRYGEREMIERVRFVHTIRNDDQLLGLTTPTVGNRNSIAIALGTHNMPNRFSERARMVIVHHTIPHEIGHAASVTHLRTLGHELVRNGELEWATEYFNDRYVMSRLREPSQGEFYTWGRQWIEEWFEWDNQVMSKSARDKFIRAIADGVEPHEVPYRYINARAKARLHDRLDVETRMLDQLEDGFRGDEFRNLAPEVKQRVRDEFRRLTEDLEIDAVVYEEHILDAEIPENLIEMLCRKYRFIRCIGVGADPNVGENPDPVDPREIVEEDAGEPDAEDPRNINRRDVGSNDSEDSDETGADVLTVGGSDAADEGEWTECRTSDEFPGDYRFPSIAHCRKAFPDDPRCERLDIEIECFTVRGSSCACSVGDSSLSRSAPFATALLALLFFRRRFRRR